LDDASQGQRARFDDSSSQTSSPVEFDLPLEPRRQHFFFKQQPTYDQEEEIALGNELASGKEK